MTHKWLSFSDDVPMMFPVIFRMILCPGSLTQIRLGERCHRSAFGNPSLTDPPSGIPRRATGPPRSGAGVGVGMLRGYHNVSSRSQRFKNLTKKAIK